MGDEHQRQSSWPRKNVLVQLGILILLSVIAFCHVWRIAENPAGFYVDEASIGFEGLTIARTGHDSHKVTWPVYFESFGDYKSPLMIYLVAAVYTLVSPSVATLRLITAGLFALYFLCFLTLFRRLFPHQSTVFLYGMLAVGFCPWFFTLSRIGFEVMLQVMLFTASLLLIHVLYHRTKPVPIWLPFLTATVLGLSFYTYQTAKLLTPLLIVGWVLIYFNRNTFKQGISMLSIIGLLLIPHVWFSAHHPGATTARLHEIAPYLFEDTSLHSKLSMVVNHYGAHWSPSFLIYHGDANRRHSTGFGGQLLVGTFVLTIIGGVYMIRKRLESDKFVQLLVFLTLTTPLAAAVTQYQTPHAIRSALFGVCLLLISGYGAQVLSNSSVSHRNKTFFLMILFVTTIQAVAYTAHYFTQYPIISRAPFQSYGFVESLHAAVAAHPSEIVISSTDAGKGGHEPRVFARFFTANLDNPSHIPIHFGAPFPTPGTCAIIFVNHWPETIPMCVPNPDSYQVRSLCF